MHNMGAKDLVFTRAENCFTTTGSLPISTCGDSCQPSDKFMALTVITLNRLAVCLFHTGNFFSNCKADEVIQRKPFMLGQFNSLTTQLR